MGLILDCSLFIALERRRFDWGAFHAKHGGQLHVIASMTLAELQMGVLRAYTAERRMRRAQSVTQVTANYPVLPFGTDQALRYAELFVELQSAGQMIGSHDLQIAAVALAGGHSVATLNPRDFTRVPALTVLDAGEFRKDTTAKPAP